MSKAIKILIIVLGSIIGLAILLFVILFSVYKEFRDIIYLGINMSPYSFQVYPKLNKLISTAGSLTPYSFFEGKKSTDFSKSYITYKENGELVSLPGLRSEILYDDPKLQGKYVTMVTSQLVKQQFTNQKKLDRTYKDDLGKDGEFITYEKNDVVCQMDASNSDYWKECASERCPEDTAEPPDAISSNYWHYHKLLITCGKAMDNVLKQDYDSFYSLLHKDYTCQDMIVYVVLNNQKFASGSAGCNGEYFGGESWLAAKRNGKWQVILTVNMDEEPPICTNIFQEYKVPPEFTKAIPCSENY